jgi:hypothetical protein
MPKCQSKDCKVKYAVFNYEGQKKGILCAKHKEDGMIDVKNQRCKKEGCESIRPNFNVEGEKKGIYCDKHKEPNMVNVVNPICKKEGCKSRPHFNVEGEKKGIYCGKHKKLGMVDIKSQRCKKEGCESKCPVFNFEDQTKGMYCNKHKELGMVDVKNPRCKSDWCDTQVNNKKYEGYCMPCFVNNPENADKPGMRNYKTKELEVVNHIKKHFENYSWNFDKKIQDGCSKRRPDIFLDVGTHVLIVEIDENMHSSYECSCENKRIMILSQDVGHRPITFIRFNPDGYIDFNGTKIRSCWSLSKLGVMTISNKKQWSERINKLIETIKHYIENNSEKIIDTIQLFY